MLWDLMGNQGSYCLLKTKGEGKRKSGADFYCNMGKGSFSFMHFRVVVELVYRMLAFMGFQFFWACIIFF